MAPSFPDDAPARTFHRPVFCDIVMKGGVTSGVSYPRAIGELARRFHLKNLGGSSAGAIAAAAAAAAEYRRRTSENLDDMGGFEILEKLPDWLGREGHLVQLFRPDRRTHALFDLALKAAAYQKARLLRLLLRCWRHWPLALLAASLPGLVLTAFALASSVHGASIPLATLGGLGGLFIALTGFAVLLLRLLRGQLKAVVEGRFGLSSGMAQAPAGEAPSLTPWLHGLLNELAGLPSERPLTFGDLWNAPVPAAGRGLLREGEPSIDLKMITTAITHGRPYELPFRENTLYFQPDTFRELFPAEVVQWMVEHSPTDPEGLDPSGWRRLPAARDLPVVVATRMSLSFPGLISAVPLGGIDFDRPALPGGRRPLEVIWFSDGGISSNFPIHFFDSMVPRWPTIAINLRQFSPDPSLDRGSRSRDNVYAIHRRSDGATESWRRIQARSPAGMMGRFFAAVLDTMQNWYDDSHLPLPGYRDRVVEIWQTKYEGGLNLDMDDRTVRRLAHKGLRAGQLMAARFSRPSSEDFRLGWDDHRWARYRSIMAAVAEAHADLQRTLYHSTDWEALILRDRDEPPASLRFDSPQQARQAWKATTGLLDLQDEWEAMGTTVEAHLGPFRGAPSPRARLGVKAMG